ncbi:MAG: hypothetical protein JRF33_15470, partial [Deltaproteobacteria bacterium]|nr:hypothetical protein [Deltaproteobacteria bacterium]
MERESEREHFLRDHLRRRQVLPDHRKYCLITDVAECFTSLDCPEGDTCAIGVSADYTNLFGECMNVGGLPPGSECNDEDDPNELPYEERCSAFYCFGDMCSEVCQVDTDCPEG